MDFGLIAASVTTALAPFTPFLIEASKDGSKKLLGVIGERGGEAAWDTAQKLWGKIKSHLGEDPKVKGAALMVSDEPENEELQKMLASALAIRLKEKPDLAQELFELVGGQNAVQKVVADRKSWVSDVTQQIRRNGEQSIKADRNSRIKNIKQINS